MVRGRLTGTLLAAVAGVAAAAGTATAAEPRQPNDYEQIRRELRIGADVLSAALADALPESRRVLEVEAGYLADQGVMVIVDLANPWFRVDGRSIDVDPEITSLEQIPDMVQEILTELNLGLSRHQAEDLRELREIRDVQRAARAEQRALRAELREKRRQLQRADDAAGADALRRVIDNLAADLAAAEEEERAAEQDAAAVRSTLNTPPRGTGGPAPDLDRAVTETICGYGATFKSLGGGQHLNVLVRQARESRYYVFQMADVRKCQAGDLSSEKLMAESYAYEL